LRFENPKTALLQPVHGGVSQCQVRRGGLAIVTPEPAWVVVPGHQIERLGQLEVVELVIRKTHEIVRDEMIGTQFAQDGQLLALEIYIGVRNKPCKIQRQSGIGDDAGIGSHRDAAVSIGRGICVQSV